ncbi:hypothetical protein EDD86DRAFT_278019 [Gorgonomyces haynaldii]|nr:hypothetical protein EDD86DRAFT_278019 [Gorgonomyces haynaldii]
MEERVQKSRMKERVQKSRMGERVLCLDAGEIDFQFAVELNITNPEITSQQILRAEIVSRTQTDNKTLIQRKLVPREKRHRIVEQLIHLQENQVVFELLGDTQDLPWFYPLVRSYTYTYDNARVTVDVDPLEGYAHTKVFELVVKKIIKIGRGHKNGYQKRVHHDLVHDKIEFQNLYEEIKTRHKHWVEQWPEATDPQKFVFEDIGIATYLILLFKKYPRQKTFDFVDIGCGNGFLTHILTQEGFKGYGLDLAERKIWDMFACDLRKETIQPQIYQADADWIIGNHADELTMWIPIFAQRSQSRFVIIPCCPFLLDGTKFGKTQRGVGRYALYTQHVKSFCQELGFTVKEDTLRIPSTKNKCLLSTDICAVSASDDFRDCSVRLRRSDRELTFERLEKQSLKHAKPSTPPSILEQSEDQPLNTLMPDHTDE